MKGGGLFSLGSRYSEEIDVDQSLVYFTFCFRELKKFGRSATHEQSY